MNVTEPGAYRDAAERLFGARLPLAQRYAELLADDGVARGLIGPREAPRLWERHLLNCAAAAELIPDGATVVDVGSGAGLPGIALAVAKPNISVILVESLMRRTVFLEMVIDELGLGERVTAVRGRAEDQVGRMAADVVTARAVAPLDRLAGWCLPLLSVGGSMLALKGASAAEEIESHAAAVARLGGGRPSIRLCGVGVVEPPTTVVEIVRERPFRTKATRSPGRPARARRQRG